MAFSGLSQIEAYWEALRGSARAPARQQIDPRGLEPALDKAFLAEAVADSAQPGPLRPPEVRLRLAGRALCDAMGMEVRGMLLSALVRPPDRPALTALVDRVLNEAARVTVHLVVPRTGGNPPVAARLLMLPVADHAGRLTRILGGLSAPGLVPACAATGPRRFLITGQDILPAADRPAPTRAPAPEMAEKAVAFIHAARLRATKVPHLKVVEAADDADRARTGTTGAGPRR